MSYLRSLSLALVLAFSGSPADAGTRYPNVASHETTEKQLAKYLLDHSYGGLTSGHVAFKVDIRPNPLTVDGQHYNGYLAIQARDHHGQHCHWFMVIKPRVVTKIDKNNSSTDPANLKVDWFWPHIYKRDNGCGDPELNIDSSILTFGISHWRSIVALSDLENQFLQLPFASQHPLYMSSSSLYGTVEYEPDRITLHIGQLMMKQLQQIPLNKLLPVPMKKN